MAETPVRNKGGRPRVDSEPVTVRMPRSLLDAIDAYRRELPDRLNRPQAIRRLLAQSLPKANRRR